MLIANRNIRFIYIGILISFCLLFLESCSIPEPSWYKLANPVFLAYEHKMNLTQLDEIAENDTFNLEKQENGYLLIPYQYGSHDYSIWINDSLVIVKIDGVICDFFEYIHQKSSEVRFEYKLRKKRPDLINQMLQFLSNYDNNFVSDKELEYPDRYRSHSVVPGLFNFHLIDTLVKPVESLHWQGSVFGDTADLHFKKGMLDGTVILGDANQPILKYGFYQKGFETGQWNIVDDYGAQQWTEDWEKGELHEINYAEGNYLKRDKRIPTLREMILLHRVVFYFFVLSAIGIIYYYIKSFRSFVNPYKKKKIVEIILIIISAPIFSIGTIIATCFFIIPMIIILKGSFSWDLPNYLNGFILLPYYFFIGTIYQFFCSRVKDLIWHAALLMCLYFIIYELDFLKTLDTGVF